MGLLLAHWEVKVTVIEVNQSRAAFSSLGSQRKGDFGDRFKELTWNKLPAAHCLGV